MARWLETGCCPPLGLPLLAVLTMEVDKLVRAMTEPIANRPPDSTAGRVVHVLSAFAQGHRQLGVSEIARVTGLSKAVTHRILQELSTNHLVVQDLTSRKYMLGNGAFALSNFASAQSRLRSSGMSMISSLSEDTGETTTLSGRTGYRRIYVGQVESAQLIRISTQVGLSLPLTVGASGHAMLAFLPQADIENILAQPIPALSERTETRTEWIRDRLDRIREQGYARTDSERVADSVSFAAPVYDAINEVTGSLSVAALATRVDALREAELGRQVVAAATSLSQQLRDHPSAT